MFILIDKEKGFTSHDVVNSVRKLTGEKRVGHAGTLDPNATGLLIIAVGRESTKKLGILTNNTDKTYLASIMLGEERDTDDIEGKVISSNPNTKEKEYSIEKIEEMLKTFVGEQKQTPPIFSAIKMKGKKAYQLARKGQKVKMEDRTITIHSIKLVDYKYPKLVIECEVSSGTYIRSLARDIGRKIKTGGYLENLRRTRIGEFDVEDAVTLNNLSINNWRDFAIEL